MAKEKSIFKKLEARYQQAAGQYKTQQEQNQTPAAKAYADLMARVKGKHDRLQRFATAQRQAANKELQAALKAHGWKLVIENMYCKTYSNNNLPGLSLKIMGDCFSVHNRNDIVRPKTSLALLATVLPKLR